MHVEDGSIDTVKAILGEANKTYEGLDGVAGERWGSGSIGNWLEEKKIPFELIVPNYDRQRDAFKELFLSVREGRFKKPTVYVEGMKGPDIVIEELSVFYQNVKERWFGSPHKEEKYGIQDDSIFSIGFGMWSGRELGPEKFRRRRPDISMMFGNFY